MSSYVQIRKFRGFRWNCYMPSSGIQRSREDKFLWDVDWDELMKYATNARNGIDCSLLPEIGLGYNHMIMVIQFRDHKRWVARLRLPSLINPDAASDLESSAKDMRAEFFTTQLVASTTDIPLAKIHIIETEVHKTIDASFMLMDCLNGNTVVDLARSDRHCLDLGIPSQHKPAFLKDLACIHVQLSTTRLPQIGTILASEFFTAWSANAHFRMSEERLIAASGSHASTILPSVASFKPAFASIAERLSVSNTGPFPLRHGYFRYSDIIVDDNYRILGILHWKSAFAGPWEVFGSFPPIISIVPREMDPSSNYDENGLPKDKETLEMIRDREFYAGCVDAEEERLGLRKEGEMCLSRCLRDERRQGVIDAMSLFESGKGGWYDKVIGKFCEGG
ncbi:hypothetical protein B0J14DRAFT_604015 [Halenospora varia]|nr:hypothetical protein B0J14DRAFT_604015 [Halenospora varia]